MGFDRATAFYEEPGGALDIVPADGKWINAIVTLDAPIADGVEALIVRNGTSPEGWEIVAIGSLDSEGNPIVTFAFRVYDGAGIAAVAPNSYTFTADDLLADNVGFRLTAFFYPTTVGFPLGQIAMGVEGSVFGPVTLGSVYSNAAPDLILGAGVGSQEDWITARTICGLAGGDGDYSALSQPAHAQWVGIVGESSEMQPLSPSIDVLGTPTPVPGYTADNGWRGNNPYLPPGDAPDPLAPFIGTESLVVTGSGELTTVCGTVNFANPFDL